MSQIVKSLVADKTPQQIETETGTTSFCSWTRILPQLAQLCALKEDEEIVGIIANDTGIVLKLRYKK